MSIPNRFRYANRVGPQRGATRIINEDPNFIHPEVFLDAKCNFMQEVHCMSTNEMTQVPNDITTSLMGARQPRQ